jgi:hypothetical protein
LVADRRKGAAIGNCLISTAPAHAPSEPSKAVVVPALVGTFSYDTIVDDFDRRLVLSIAADGSYRLVMTQEESGTFQGGNGTYRTIVAKTGQIRTGTYRALGSAAIEVTSATGTAVFHPTQPNGPIDQANPIMLGVWRAIVVQGGVAWTLTVQNNPDGTYYNQARSEDNGSCAFADEKWQMPQRLQAIPRMELIESSMRTTLKS